MGAASTPGRRRPAAGRARGHLRRVARRTAARYPLATQLARYAVVGGGATAFNAALFLLVRPWLAAVPANLVALTVTTALSTELNRRFAFGGARAHRLREWVQDLGTVAFYATYTSGVLLVLQWLDPATTPAHEAAAVALASIGGGLLRFAVLRFWVFDLDGAGSNDDATHAGGPPQCSATSPPST
ncbi:GtrA family protein [Pseudonocardia parietis]|uniref:Flippase GtrA n=1 Tax=Pseudonocardia parietis TaxID=570936 RepID=A0ABS4W2S9_9PSEU|nr:GtrA family protein [Pseudonocardia parietis]MBP2370520.1 putative flippase GtrA [Pseudonocardia parietis]